MSADEKRSRSTRTDSEEGAAQEVGGRQPGLPPLQGGGGYLDICTPRKFPRLASAADLRDPRLDELARMGLPPYWLKVAEAIGVDAFLVMWRTLDSEPSLWRDPAGSGLQVRLRRYESFLRFQRNRYIEQLHEAGLTSEQIRARVASNIGEQLSERHIDRLRKQV